jgi:predicted RNA-binding Zn-ribbon protein involved in translation (DUF1610 family)
VLVEVTQADIDAGEQEECESCPVALATRRATGWPCRVDGVTIEVFHDCRWHGHDAPAEVESFVDDFDHGDVVLPFSFHLEV